jgi:hypothetical protein
MCTWNSVHLKVLEYWFMTLKFRNAEQVKLNLEDAIGETV